MINWYLPKPFIFVMQVSSCKLSAKTQFIELFREEKNMEMTLIQQTVERESNYFIMTTYRSIVILISCKLDLLFHGFLLFQRPCKIKTKSKCCKAVVVILTIGHPITYKKYLHWEIKAFLEGSTKQMILLQAQEH